MTTITKKAPLFPHRKTQKNEMSKFDVYFSIKKRRIGFLSLQTKASFVVKSLGLTGEGVFVSTS